MYRLSYVEHDALRVDEFTEAERNAAIEKWRWVKSQADITDIEFDVMTVDVQYAQPAEKTYTFFCEVDLSDYDYIDLNPDLSDDDPKKVYVYIVRSGYRAGIELKQKRKAERFDAYKPLRGTPKKFKEE